MMGLTCGELKAKFVNQPDDAPVFIEIVGRERAPSRTATAWMGN